MNKLSCIRTMAMGFFVWTIGLNAALAQTPPPPPHSHPAAKGLRPQPLVKPLSAPLEPSAATVLLSPTPSPWKPLVRQPLFNPGAMQLLTDGTVMVQDQGAKNSGAGDWYRLTPDINGSYLNGTWSKLASLPKGYAPLYYASAVLPDGRVIIAGGQYNNGEEVITNLGAIYDPLANKWTPVAPPPGSAWSHIGAAACAVIANGTFIIGGVATTQQALFRPGDLSWLVVPKNDKADINDEETWTLLPNGDLLTVDANNPRNLTNSELFRSGIWSSEGSTIVKLADINADNSGSHEMGPQLLRPNGTVFVAGATGHSAVFHFTGEAAMAATPVVGTWAKGPDFPIISGPQYAVADGPAALLPSGKVLVVASPGIVPQTKPARFFVFDGANLVPVAGPPNAASLAAYYGFMIVLPTGQIMFNSRLGDIELFTDTSPAPPNAVPVITKLSSTALVAGKSYVLTGKQLHGVSQAAAYAEGYQPATNYPLVRIVNARTKHVFYARTFDHSDMSIAPGSESFTHFMVPAGIETGAAMLYAVANGIASSNFVLVAVAAK